LSKIYRAVALSPFCLRCFWTRPTVSLIAGSECIHGRNITNAFNAIAPPKAFAMSREDEALVAAANVLRNLAHGTNSSHRSSSSSHSSTLSVSAAEPLSCKIPGPASASKEALEAELCALALRIQFLESRLDAVDRTLPDTPNESQVTEPFLEKDAEPRIAPIGFSHQTPNAAPTQHDSLSLPSTRVNNLLAAREGQSGVQETARNVSEDDISYLRDHVSRQAEEIKSQKETIAEISKGLQRSDEQSKKALSKMEEENIEVLARELKKHQQANEAFQKALREIGGIITQVANGDLSMRVQIQASEMDDEIVLFKRTINTMMDQLEVFGSEVSRVAREVGTEGILGGQAQITGVHGIWKELTENGMSILTPLWQTSLDSGWC
jgi:osomolarity two-component system, sensor histidine kinase NIK1